MDPLFIAIPLIIAVALLFAYGVGRTFVQIWAIHRKKVAILRKFEADPAAFESSQEIIERISEQELRNQKAVRQDYTVTGTCLAAIGLAALFIGRGLSYGETAVGLYIGGIACIGAGLLVAMLGYLIRALTRPLLDPNDLHQS